MGCYNPHPLCQIWASSFFPNEPHIKEHYQLEYYKKFKRPLLMDYVAKELEKKVRNCFALDQ
jgi:UDPglucose--hexose-1-phosphate uridylyltransferase